MHCQLLGFNAEVVRNAPRNTRNNQKLINKERKQKKETHSNVLDYRLVTVLCIDFSGHSQLGHASNGVDLLVAPSAGERWQF